MPDGNHPAYPPPHGSSTFHRLTGAAAHSTSTGNNQLASRGHSKMPPSAFVVVPEYPIVLPTTSTGGGPPFWLTSSNNLRIPIKEVYPIEDIYPSQVDPAARAPTHASSPRGPAPLYSDRSALPNVPKDRTAGFARASGSDRYHPYAAKPAHAAAKPDKPTTALVDSSDEEPSPVLPQLPLPRAPGNPVSNKTGSTGIPPWARENSSKSNANQGKATPPATKPTSYPVSPEPADSALTGKSFYPSKPTGLQKLIFQGLQQNGPAFEKQKEAVDNAVIGVGSLKKGEPSVVWLTLVIDDIMDQVRKNTIRYPKTGTGAKAAKSLPTDFAELLRRLEYLDKNQDTAYPHQARENQLKRETWRSEFRTIAQQHTSHLDELAKKGISSSQLDAHGSRWQKAIKPLLDDQLRSLPAIERSPANTEGQERSEAEVAAARQ